MVSKQTMTPVKLLAIEIDVVAMGISDDKAATTVFLMMGVDGLEAVDVFCCSRLVDAL